jgi:hypothetical protein
MSIMSGRRLPDGTPVLLRWVLVGLLLEVVLPASVLAGDPRSHYVGRADAILEGGRPYLDTELEHLPVLVPFLLLGRLLTPLAPGQNPAVAYGLVMVVVVVVTTAWIARAGRSLGLERDVVTHRWLWAAGPLVPLAVFRLDAVPVLALTVAVAWMLEHHPRRAAAAAAVGAAAKGFPAVLSVWLWRRGERRAAATLVAVTLVVVGILSTTPGFRSGRSFEGVHSETLTGAGLTLARSVRGADPGLVDAAGSVYVAAPQFAAGVNLAAGAVVAAWVLVVGWRRATEDRAALALCGGLVAAAIVASPLLSGQFVYWLAPFVALAGGRRTRWLLALAGLVTVALLAHWKVGEAWWSALALVRWGLVVAVGLALVGERWDGPVAPSGRRADRAQAAEAGFASDGAGGDADVGGVVSGLG